MSKKHKTHPTKEKETAAPEATLRLKVLADLFTPEAIYYQGDEVEVSAEEAARLQRDHAGYFEVLS